MSRFSFTLVNAINDRYIKHNIVSHKVCQPQTHISWPILHMMTSSNENIFRVTGLLCGNSLVTGEFPSQRPVTRILDVFCDLPERIVEQTMETPVIWDAIALILPSKQPNRPVHNPAAHQTPPFQLNRCAHNPAAHHRCEHGEFGSTPRSCTQPCGSAVCCRVV